MARGMCAGRMSMICLYLFRSKAAFTLARVTRMSGNAARRAPPAVPGRDRTFVGSVGLERRGKRMDISRSDRLFGHKRSVLGGLVKSLGAFACGGDRLGVRFSRRVFP